MESFEIVEVNKHNEYVLINKVDKTRIELQLEFYGVNKPSVGDKILIHASLLNKKSSAYTQPYAFERSEEFQPKQVKEMDMKEFIVLRKNNKNHTLKRIYG